jgi:hypothetical protein
MHRLDVVPKAARLDAGHTVGAIKQYQCVGSVSTITWSSFYQLRFVGTDNFIEEVGLNYLH